MNQGETESKRAKREKVCRFFVMAVYVLTGFICAVIIFMGEGGLITQGSSLGELLIRFGAVLLAMVIIFFLHITVHEAGHLVCGLLTGYRFCSYRIGSLMLIKTNGQFKLKQYALPGTGGQCLMAPPDMAEGKMPYMLYHLGGCLFNLLFSLLAFLFSLFCREGGVMLLFWLVTAVIGITMAVINGVPMQMSMVNNDGYNAWTLGKHPRELRAFWIQMKVMEQITDNVRLKDMPDDWFELPSDEEMQSPMCAAVAVFACNRLLDSMKLQEAAELMDRLLNMESGMVELHRNILTEDSIFCELVGENRLKRLLELMSGPQYRFEDMMKKNPYILRTRYAFCLLSKIAQIEEGPDDFAVLSRRPAKPTPSGDDRARQCKEQFEKYARTYPYPCEIESQRELMAYTDVQKEKLREKIRQEQNQSAI